MLLIISILPVYGFRIVSYNVENLFDCVADSVHDDSEFTPEGMRYWTPARYYHKREHIARTIANIGGWDGVAIVGLCEVENEQCIRDLCSQNLRNLPYSYIHFDSPDLRGIDVAMLYRTDLFQVISALPVPVPVAANERPTRDILYVSGITQDGDTLHLLLCHLPSQLGGASRASLRQHAKQTITAYTDSIFLLHPNARVVVMGDMNSAPANDLQGLSNCMIPFEQSGRGTYKYQGAWSCIDQFYVSPSLADTVQVTIYDAPWLLTPDEAFTGWKPFRTYHGYQYQPDGHSDHLPIVMDIPSIADHSAASVPIESIIEDIYSQITEDGLSDWASDYETLSEQLLQQMAHPVPLNSCSYDALSELPFLSEEQISRILLKVRDMPLNSLYELQLVGGLKDYELRNLLPFVEVGQTQPEPFYWRELGAYGRHELSVRTDVRNAEAFTGSDPVYIQAKYGYTYKRMVTAGVTLRRPAAGSWQDLQYGGYVQLSDIGRLKRFVGGCYQARFGQGLVTNHFFHTGHSSRIMQIGGERQGLSKVSSAGSERYQGVGATIKASQHTEVSAWYSVDNSKVWNHALGANINANFKRLRVGLTVMEHLYSDSLPVRNTYYNAAYFRGNRQLVIGADLRYAFRWAQLFAEVAAAQNSTWGGAAIVGVRFTPKSDLGLVALYRYYSPHFDNAYGYAFAQGSRLGDEQGGYIGVEYKGIRNWRLSAYGDVFYFQGPKYGIRQSGTIGYEVLGQAEYMQAEYTTLLSLRSRMKGDLLTHRARAEFIYTIDQWRLRTRGDLSLVQRQKDTSSTNAQGATLSVGGSVSQDIEYHVRAIPMVWQLRLQGFDIPQWDNRIYSYENDVLYAFSIPATYGRGGRWYLNGRYHITEQIALYLRLSQTVYHPQWALDHSRPITRTDVHVMLRARL